MKMNINLQSNFHDYYDYVFDSHGIPLYRYKEEFNFLESKLRYLNKNNVVIATSGKVYYLYKYIDEYGLRDYIDGLIIEHNGQLKYVHLEDGFHTYPNCFGYLSYISEFEKIHNIRFMYRHYYIGSLCISTQFMFERYDDKLEHFLINSHKIKVSHTYLSQTDIIMQNDLGRKYHVYSIDTLNSGLADHGMAINVELNPTLKGTLIENLISPEEIKDRIQEKIHLLRIAKKQRG